jgi:indole-3-glycerol phosphate synthase
LGELFQESGVIVQDILAKILVRKAERLAEAKRKVSPAEIEKHARHLPPPAFDFLEILKAPAASGIHVIAEVKKASPSKGVLREDFQPLEIAQAYARGGASALSVLTEEDFFLGSDAYLQEIASLVSLPALRKDFLTEAYQVFEAKILGASAYLLIAACLEESALRNLIALGKELSLTALVEVHDEKETEAALRAGASLIGINNRDLRTFRTSLETTLRLRRFVPREIPIVSESGIFTREDVLQLQAESVNAILVGESLIRESDPEAKLRELLDTE